MQCTHVHVSSACFTRQVSLLEATEAEVTKETKLGRKGSSKSKSSSTGSRNGGGSGSVRSRASDVTSQLSEEDQEQHGAWRTDSLFP